MHYPCFKQMPLNIFLHNINTLKPNTFEVIDVILNDNEMFEWTEDVCVHVLV